MNSFILSTAFISPHLNSDTKIIEKDIELLGKKFPQKIYPLENMDEKLPLKIKRRMSFLSRMLVSTGQKCIENAKCEGILDKLTLIIGTGWGESEAVITLLQQLYAENPPALSPTLFHSSVHNVPSGYFSILSSCKGPTLTVSQGKQSFEAALEVGLALLKAGETEYALVGAGDVSLDLAVLDNHILDDIFFCASYFVLLEKTSSTNLFLQYISSFVADSEEEIFSYWEKLCLEIKPDLTLWTFSSDGNSLTSQLSNRSNCLIMPYYGMNPSYGGESFAKIVEILNNQIANSVLWFSVQSNNRCYIFLVGK